MIPKNPEPPKQKLRNIKRKTEQVETIQVVLTVQPGIHHKPALFNFKKYQKVIVCETCKLNVAIEDVNEYEPCQNCGGMFNGILSYIGTFDKERKKWLRVR